MWIQDACKVYMDSYMASNGHLDYSQKLPLRGRPNTKPGDHGTMNAHNQCFILIFIMCEDPHE